MNATEPTLVTLFRHVSRACSIPTKRLNLIVRANVPSNLDEAEQERMTRLILNRILDRSIDLGPQPRRRPSRTS